MLRLRIILWIIFLLLWFIGDFLPILPWPLLSYMAIVFFQIADKNWFTTSQMIIFWVSMAIITTVDYITPIIWTKKMWWTKRWTRWSTIWLIVWVIILPLLWIVLWPFGLIWLLWWPFAWAYIWEILYQKNEIKKLQNNNSKKKTQPELNHKKALKAALWSFIWFLWWILLKIIYTIVVAIYIIPRFWFVIHQI